MNESNEYYRLLPSDQLLFTVAEKIIHADPSAIELIKQHNIINARISEEVRNLLLHLYPEIKILRFDSFLHLAANNGQIEITKLLLQVADINKQILNVDCCNALKSLSHINDFENKGDIKEILQESGLENTDNKQNNINLLDIFEINLKNKKHRIYLRLNEIEQQAVAANNIDIAQLNQALAENYNDFFVGIYEKGIKISENDYCKRYQPAYYFTYNQETKQWSLIRIIKNLNTDGYKKTPICLTANLQGFLQNKTPAQITQPDISYLKQQVALAYSGNVTIESTIDLTKTPDLRINLQPYNTIFNENGLTLLQNAARYGWYNIARLLINIGAKVNLQSLKTTQLYKVDLTALSIAKSYKHHSIVSLLQDHKEEKQEEEKEEEKPVEELVEEQAEEPVEELVEEQAEEPVKEQQIEYEQQTEIQNDIETNTNLDGLKASITNKIENYLAKTGTFNFWHIAEDRRNLATQIIEKIKEKNTKQEIIELLNNNDESDPGIKQRMFTTDSQINSRRCVFFQRNKTGSRLNNCINEILDDLRITPQ